MATARGGPVAKMRLLLDEMVPRSIATFLRDRGHEVKLVQEVLMPGTPDAVVAEVGDRWDMIVVTWNTKDYRPLADRAPRGTRRHFRRLGRISFKCHETRGLERLVKVIDHIEFEYRLVQRERDQRLIVEISTTDFRVIR